MKSVSVLLRDQSGFEREIIEEWDDSHEDIIVYMWEYGNYACDCNRSLFLYDLDYDGARECNSGNPPTITVVMLKIDGVPMYSETQTVLA